jgi:hypothetical protein
MTPTELLRNTIRRLRINQARELLADLKRSLASLNAADRDLVIAELNILAGVQVRRAA